MNADALPGLVTGLAETGETELAELEHHIIERVKQAGIRFIGPNCMGLYVPAVGLSFMPMLPQDTGNVFMLSQSGANANAILRGLGDRGLRFTKGVSFGNGADVRAHELLAYALADPETKYVVGYMEGAQDARLIADLDIAGRRDDPGARVVAHFVGLEQDRRVDGQHRHGRLRRFRRAQKRRHGARSQSCGEPAPRTHAPMERHPSSS